MCRRREAVPQRREPAAAAKPAPKALPAGPAIAGRTATTQPAAGQGATAKAQAKFVNTRCPIMAAINPAKVPDALVLAHKGQKGAVCCMCLPTWDKLTPEQKDAKLKPASQPG